MRSKEALKVLGVTRVSLYNYVKKGLIKVTKLKNGFYEYDNKSIYDFIGKRNRKNVIYARVSTIKQKDDLNKQIKYISSIIIVSDMIHKIGVKSNDLELYEDLLAMMHYFATKTYSIRKNVNLY